MVWIYVDWHEGEGKTIDAQKRTKDNWNETLVAGLDHAIW